MAGMVPCDMSTNPDIKGMPNSLSIKNWPDSENQSLHGEVYATVHRLIKDPDEVQFDYFGVFGHMNHGVRHNAPATKSDDHSDPQAGYLATILSLELDLVTSGGKLYDSGPQSTVGTDTTSYNIGGGLNGILGAFSGVGGSITASVSHSYSTPDVAFSWSPQDTSVRWDVTLPHSSPHARQPSFAGYEWYFGAIFEMPAGAKFAFSAAAEVPWVFTYDDPSPGSYYPELKKDEKLWDETKAFEYVPQADEHKYFPNPAKKHSKKPDGNGSG